ncbi:MAG: 2-hydroxyacyl-CoA dehydratase [Longicatena sp.]
MNRVEFTKEMKKTHTILVPMMLPIHFAFLQNILQKDGYKVEILKTEGQQIIDEGLKNVHNDTCYPALLVIGQMIDALKSGAYDVDHVALAITQTGGGCRASNYIHLLRKALIQAGFAHVPVISVNFSNLEKNSGFKLTPKILLRIIYAFLYSDMLMWIKNQCKPYEVIKGSADALVTTWVETITAQFDTFQFLRLKKNYREMLHDFASIERSTKPKIQVGIVGEIYMKYAPLGNGDLEDFLIKEGCEPVLSGVMDFALYCLENSCIDHEYYNHHKWSHMFIRLANTYIQHLQSSANITIKEQGVFREPDTFKEVIACSEGIINRGNKMGEGWLLTSEMVALIKQGINNIVCCQPFGCLPNHIVAKGMTRKLKTIYPNANIVAVDYDPSATKVNQENRLKLMLSNARLNEQFYGSDEVKLEHDNAHAYAYESR